MSPIDFYLDSPIYVLLCAHCLLGGVAAIIAQRKGRPLGRWLVWGLVGGTATLLFTVLMKPEIAED